MGWDERDGASYISRLERGKRNAGPDVQKRFCEVFGVEQGELFRSESEWNVSRETVRITSEPVTGSYGVSDLSKHRAVEVVAPTREDARTRLVGQLDKILDHPDQTIVRAITANLEAFATVAEHGAEIAALRKELEEIREENKTQAHRIEALELQNKILIENLREVRVRIDKSQRPDGGPERRAAFNAIRELLEQHNGGPE